MTLSTGTRLSHYEITSQLGKGGMGEVYQATDTKLGRDVAIKVLPEEFAKDTDRVTRFQREAKLLASLNHPNIAAIHGLEEADGTHFLVMELIEGDTLDDRIKSGAIPVEEALKLALQITEALEAAHDKGVIHRDLKPANIKVTPEGQVKVLDFGLAKAYSGEQDQVSLSNSPTLSQAATMQGVILGTAAYMSPEQAKGKTVDKRTDVWAFGVVLYEMLTGQPVFAADDVSQTLARVLERKPDFSTLPPNLHPKILEMLDRCMEKDFKNRYSSISDARVDIQKVLADPNGVFVQPVTTEEPRTRMRTILPWVTVTAILCLIIAGVAGWILKPLEPKKVIRFDHETPEGQQLAQRLAISPEGSHFVYRTDEGLYVHSFDEFNARLIKGTDGNSVMPFFSPDGNWLYYWDSKDNELKKVDIRGGAPVALFDTPITLGPSWNEDDTIIYGTLGQGIMQVSAAGGAPETLIEANGAILYGPQILPNGKFILYVRSQNNINMVLVHSLDSGENTELFQGDEFRYLPTGHLVYELESNLLAVPFDPGTGKVTGGTASMVDDVGAWSTSDTGTLVYMHGTEVANYPRTLVWVDREGREEPIEEEPRIYRHPKISPDGTKVALTVAEDGNYDIYVYDIVREIMTLLTSDDAFDCCAIWTPNGERIIFDSGRTGRESIFSKAADGKGNAEQLLSIPNGYAWPFSISRDGSTLFFGQFISASKSGYDIGMFSMDSDDRSTVLLLQGEHSEINPIISPNERWLAYMSNESGQYQVFIRSFPDIEDGIKRQVSRNGGTNPLWSSDSQELFYRNGDTTMVVSIETEPIFELGKPEVLFQGTYFQEPNRYGGMNSWDISPDGERFLMMKEADTESTEETSQPRINVVLNWFEELKEKVPVD